MSFTGALVYLTGEALGVTTSGLKFTRGQLGETTAPVNVTGVLVSVTTWVHKLTRFPLS